LTKGRIVILSPHLHDSKLIPWTSTTYNTCFWSPRESALKRHLDRFSCFAYTAAKTPKCFSIEQTTSKIVPFPWGSGPSSNTWFLGLSESATQTEFPLVQPNVTNTRTDTQTDHATPQP